MSSNKCIFLSGFMASGKSRIGRLLSQKLSRPFYDTDNLIEIEAGKTISEIFEQEGEEAFRKLEEQTVIAISPTSRAVVSLGGGAILSKNTRDHITKGLWVFLNPPFEELQTRISRKSHRPLAKDPEKLKDLYESRLPLYKQAPLIIECHGEAEDVCQQLLQRLIQKP